MEARRAVALSRRGAPWVALPPSAGLQPDGRAIDEQYLDEHTRVLGELSVNIVGCQYYAGVVHAGEMAGLVREPSNPYDKNAIRVENLGGTKVGHIKRAQAAALAPLLDERSAAAPRAEISIPREPTNMYEVLAVLKVVGLPAHAPAIEAHLRTHNLQLHQSYLGKREARAAAAVARAAPAASQAEVVSLPPGWERAVDPSTGRMYYFHRRSSQRSWEPPTEAQRQIAIAVGGGAGSGARSVVKVDAAKSQEELDALFEKELAGQASISTAKAAEALRGSVVLPSLLAHQLQARACDFMDGHHARSHRAQQLQAAISCAVIMP